MAFVVLRRRTSFPEHGLGNSLVLSLEVSFTNESNFFHECFIGDRMEIGVTVHGFSYFFRNPKVRFTGRRVASLIIGCVLL
uniref:Uncharacterized protein n=1 Tax=Candidatus Kentrum sp. LFY TaxID=2126342 RepID=A0A450WSU1_9GAMM|nr:MAG: hypothetical protein BECKLFY1418C_GA0070996_10684 [Candidatus Kentron sp. LFY]